MDLVNRILVAAGLLALATPASAVDVDFAGYYRARARAYSSLSMDRDATDSEGLSMGIQHRLLLRPTFYINENIQVTADIRALEGLYWGNSPAPATAFTSDQTVANATGDDMQTPGSGASNIELWRAWAELRSGDHTFRFGRMPLNWGSGILWNDGLGYNADYGDSADRIQWEGLFGDIYASAAIDVNAEGFINDGDDTTSFNGMVAYRSETVTAGLLAQVRHTPNPNLTIVTLDGAVEAEIGKIDLEAEVVGHFGEGDLTDDISDIRIASVGAVLDASIGFDFATLGVAAGLATGDGDLTDTTYSTFTFDRDYNVGILMFEQPMPTFAATIPTETNGGRNFDEVVVGNAVSNAIFLRPRVQRTIAEMVELEGSVLWARTLAAPSTSEYEGRQSYGFEIDAAARYVGMEHLELGLTGGLLLPGNWFTEVDDRELTGPVFGAQLLGRVVF